MAQKSCQSDKNSLSYEFLKKKPSMTSITSSTAGKAFSLKIHNSVIFYPIDMIFVPLLSFPYAL